MSSDARAEPDCARGTLASSPDRAQPPVDDWRLRVPGFARDIRDRLRAVPRWRFLVLILVPLALIVGREVHVAMSHDIPVEVRWDDRDVERVDVTYDRGTETVQSVVFHPPAGARSVRHAARLSTGRYAVTVQLVGASTRTYRRRVDAPSEGLVILRVGGER